MGRGGSVPSPGGSNTREGATTAARQALTLFSKEGLPERLNGIPALLQGVTESSHRPTESYDELATALHEHLGVAMEHKLTGTGTCPLSRWMYDWYGAGGERRRFATRCLLTPLLWTYVCRCSNATVDVTGFEACLRLVHSAQRPAPPLRMPASAPADVTVRSPAWVDADAPVIAAPAIAAEGALRPAERWVVCASAINEVVQQLPHSPFTALQFCSLVTRWAATGHAWAASYQTGPWPAGMREDTVGVPFSLPPVVMRALAAGLGVCLHGRQAQGGEELQAVAAAAASMMQRRATFDLDEHGMLLMHTLLTPLPPAAVPTAA